MERDLDKFIKQLFKSPPAEAPFGFADRVMRRVEAASAPKTARIIPVGWFAPAIGMAAMLLLAILPSSPATAVSADMLFMNNPMDKSSQVLMSAGMPQEDEMLEWIEESI